MSQPKNAIDCPDCGTPMLWKNLEKDRCPKCTPLPEDQRFTSGHAGEIIDSVQFLHLLADIRAAAGDPEGKLMQDELVAHISDLRRRATDSVEYCTWHTDDNGCWMGDCGIQWYFEDSGPEENGVNHCPKCGKPQITAVTDQEGE